MELIASNSNNQFKLFVIYAFVSIIFAVTFLCEGIFDIGIGFTHFYYLPIVLTTLWWGVQGIRLSVFLGAFLVATHFFFNPTWPLAHDVFRAVMFISISCVIWKFQSHSQKDIRYVAELEYQQKQMFEDLLECSKRFRLLFNSGHDAILIHYLEQKDFSGTLIDVNDTACRMLGYSKTELLKLSPAHLTPFEIRKNFPDYLKILSTDRHLSVESKYIAKDGKIIPVECRLYPFEYDKKPAVLVVARDITSRRQLEAKLEAYRIDLENLVQKRTQELIDINALLNTEIRKHQDTEKALRESEFRYRTIVEDIPTLVCRFYPDGTMTFVNTQYCNYFNKSALELTGRNFFEFIPENQREGARNHLRSFTPQRPVISYEHQAITADGQLHWQNWIDRAFFDDQGNILEYQSIGIDITERKQAEIDLIESQAMLQAVFDGISEPLFLINSDLSIKKLNKAALSYRDISDMETTLNRPCFQIIQKIGGPCESCRIVSAIESGERKSFEQKNPFNPDRIELVVIYPLPASGDCSDNAAIVCINDITKRKKLDQQLMRANRLSSLGQLAAGIAHEIRNPLSGISLFVDILSDPGRFPVSDQQLEILGEIRENTNRISVIIQHALNFAKPPVTAKKIIPVNDVIHEALKLWRTKFRKADINLKLALDQTSATIFGDMLQLQQVMHNLISNAADAMESGGTLFISSEQGKSSIEPDTAVVRITVADTGCGICEEYIDTETIFNPFYTTKPAGTGLGLAITHNIIKEHHGNILVETKAGQGTRFDIELPVEQPVPCN